MHADSFFVGSKTHRVCEDYVRLGENCVVVSDGCSSSPDTDVGARLLVLAALNKKGCVWQAVRTFSPGVLIDAADRLRGAIGWLPPQCLDATLLCAYVIPEGVEVQVAGDGFVVARERGTTNLLVYEFDFGNAPAYLSYLLDDDRKKAYLQQGFGRRTITVSRFTPEGQSLLSVHHDNPFTGEADYPGVASPFWTHTFSQDKYDLVMLCTDGVNAFQDQKTFDPIPYHQVIRHLTQIPSFTGEFIARRVRKFVSKECVELGWAQNDDLGVGAIYLGETGSVP